MTEYNRTKNFQAKPISRSVWQQKELRASMFDTARLWGYDEPDSSQNKVWQIQRNEETGYVLITRWQYGTQSYLYHLRGGSKGEVI